MTNLAQIEKSPQPPAHSRNSPDWVQISYASALALRLKSGRFKRQFDFGGINLLLTYDQGCRSDCGYCGLARSRQGAYQDKSFIRVEWPLVSTDQLIERMAAHQGKLKRLCISMVTHGYAYRDTLEIARRMRRKIATPLSILVAPPTLDQERLRALKGAGADMIGIGLDAVTEELFRRTRGDVPKGGLKWHDYWRVVNQARDVYGPWKVNCHTLVGLGETDHDLMTLFERLLDRQVFSYLFCFNPEPDSRMAEHPRTSIKRWRRVQLAKYLLEEAGLEARAFDYHDDGSLARIHAPAELVERVVSDGHAFMTNGCPSAGGEPGCTRPMGSWRPSEAPRDYPWQPTAADRASIHAELRLAEILRPGPAPTRPLEHRAPPAAGSTPSLAS